MKQILSFLVACLLPFTLLASEVAGKNKAKMQEQVFELPISKMPHYYFKYEATFFTEIETDCNFGFLLGGKLETKEDARGIYYEFSGGNELSETLMHCKDGRKKRHVYYEFKQILPGISPIRIVTPQGVQAEIRVFELAKTLESKKERKNR